MSTEGHDASGGKSAGCRGLLCPSCDRLNPQGLKLCDRCGRSLFYFCGACGEENQLVFSQCRKCGRRGREASSGKLSVLSLGSGVLNPVTILVVISVVVLVFVLTWALRGNAVLRLW